MVCRPDCLTSPALVLITPPPDVIAKISSPGVHHQRADQLAAGLDDLRGDDAAAAAALHRVGVGGRALGVPAAGGHEHVAAVPDHVHAEQLVAVVEAHPDDARGVPAHRPQRLVVGVEPDGLRALADQQQVLLGRDQPGRDDLVVLAQVDRDDAAGPGESKSVSLDFFTSPLRVASTR